MFIYLVLQLAVFGTSLLSAIFGMAGGMILMGIYAAVLPVAGAMILHGATQATANGYRWFLLRGHTDKKGLKFYALGCLLSAALLSLVAFVPSRPLLFLMLGALPMLSAVLPASPVFTFSSRAGAVLCGVLVTGAQLMAGVSGPLLDLFFVRSALSKEQVIATKALTQTFSHLLKLAYFVRLTGDVAPELELPLWVFPLSAVFACLGTRAGALLLHRLSDRQFRTVSQVLVLCIGAVYLVRGLRGLLAGAP